MQTHYRAALSAFEKATTQAQLLGSHQQSGLVLFEMGNTSEAIKRWRQRADDRAQRRTDAGPRSSPQPGNPRQ